MEVNFVNTFHMKVSTEVALILGSPYILASWDGQNAQLRKILQKRC